MHVELVETTVTCPHCWEAHPVNIDVSAGDQTYIEDCSVCCHPIELSIVVDDHELISLTTFATQ